MVRPGDVIADGFGRVAAKKHRARMFDAGEKRARIGGGDFQMLRRDSVHQRGRILELATTMMAPCSIHERAAMSRRGRAASWRSTSAATESANAASSVIRTDCEEESCSAWESRSAAIQAGSLAPSATTRISDGPAMESMPTRPKTSRLAAAT